MEKITFENLPSTNTPINSTNLNQVQDNVEKVFNGEESMGSIVVEDIACKNLFNKNTVIHGYWINNGVLEANALWDTSDYIKVEPNTTYSFSSTLISGKSEIQANIIYYDADKNRISSSYFQTLTKTEATPSNCYYVRILYRNDVQENIQFEEGSVTNYVEHKEFDNAIVQANVDALASKLNAITKNTGSAYGVTFNGTLTGRYIFMYMAILNGDFGLAGVFVISNGVLKKHTQFVGDETAGSVTITPSTTGFTITFARNYTVCTIISPNVALT